MGFLMHHIDPSTMTLDLGDGRKRLQFTAETMYILFGLPHGRNAPPMPSENGFDEALMKLREELGVPRDKHIETKYLRLKLEELVKDPTQDALAMKVFGLIFYMKFVCPGSSVRVSREAPMVQDFRLADLHDVDMCQLLLDEFKRAVILWQKPGSEWKAIPGCGIAAVLAYLDCLKDRVHGTKDMRTPRVLYMDPTHLRALADKDCFGDGNSDIRSWKFGQLQVSIIYLSYILYFASDVVISFCIFIIYHLK